MAMEVGGSGHESADSFEAWMAAMGIPPIEGFIPDDVIIDQIVPKPAAFRPVPALQRVATQKLPNLGHLVEKGEKQLMATDLELRNANAKAGGLAPLRGVGAAAPSQTPRVEEPSSQSQATQHERKRTGKPQQAVEQGLLGAKKRKKGDGNVEQPQISRGKREGMGERVEGNKGASFTEK